jgi:DNA-binding IclR family transcriptional regulator
MKNLLLQKFHQVLEIVAVNGVQTLSELSAELDIPLPTLGRLISDMTEMNLLEKIDH